MERDQAAQQCSIPRDERAWRREIFKDASPIPIAREQKLDGNNASGRSGCYPALSSRYKLRATREREREKPVAAG